MAISQLTSKRKIIGIGYPKFAIEEFKKLQEEYDIHYFVPTTRQQVVSEFAKICKEHGPFEAGYVLFGTSAYSPFDPELLSPLFTTPGVCGLWAQGGAGYDDVSVPWLGENGCVLSNTPYAVSESTADMSLLLILNCLRNIPAAEKNARESKWREGLGLSTDPNGLRLGIIGMGTIGQILAKKASVAFEMEVVYNNRNRLSPEKEAELGAKWVPFEELISTSDVISLNCPLNDSTRGILSAPQFEKMKDGVVIANTARGPVIDEKALIAALESGKVAKAGLDVFDQEPKVNEWFKTSDKVLLQPHVGAFTKGTMVKGERAVFGNVRQFMETGKPMNPVNEAKKIVA